LALTLSILAFTLSMMLDFLVLREIISPSKGALIWALVRDSTHRSLDSMPLEYSPSLGKCYNGTIFCALAVYPIALIRSL
jgi:hypothetical protein